MPSAHLSRNHLAGARKKMAENKKIYSMSSTHKTIKDIVPTEESNKLHKSEYLFTLLVKDKNIKRGIPVASLACKSESQYPLKAWLQWLKDDCDLQTDAFMVDCTEVESTLIQDKKCDMMRPFFNTARHATNALDQKTKWDQFKEKFSTQTRLIKYTEDKWFNKTGVLQRWAEYHRMLNSEGPSTRPLRQEDKRKRDRAYQIPIAEAARIITVKDVVDNNLRLTVKSFKTFGVEYIVTIVTTSIVNQLLLLCTCPDYTLWLNNRNIPEARIDVLPDNNNELRPELREFLPAAIAERNAQVLLIVDAQHAIEEDAKKRKWAEESKREFAEERAELLTLLARMKNSVEKLKDMRDLTVLKSFKVRVKEIPST
ncbi:hypothetical protein BGZ51_007538 [Haplosporangium sp. Z 767]|nr:hypothetical protein BGZ50_007545 [Haplosporangium sp. Z 11]KAF9178710.1 hypothetical protein BGZ51_007538 [Haplosporangium sp. Z 767]